jgi:polysaccharide export outer membrane protein
MEQSLGTMPAPGFVVDHQGVIQFPFLSELKLAGLTAEEARVLLTNKLAAYINKPVVTLRVQSFRSKRIYIDGDVKMPGLQAINDIPMTLMEALNRAGGMLPTADQSHIVLSREAVNYNINLPALFQKGLNPAGIILKDGDALRVSSRDETKVFISGEVLTPRALPMRNGRLSLNEALGESGGVNPQTGDARQIYVIRKSSNTSQVYLLDARTPGALALAEEFELRPKDIVFVAATPLTNWHRTISQILPGALSGAIGSIGTVAAPR